MVIPPQEWTQTLSKTSELDAARSLSTSVDELDELASSANATVRAAVAKNLGAQKATIVRLLSDPDWTVRSCALAHKSVAKADTRQHLEEALVEHPDFVLRHRHVTADLIQAVYESGSDEVLEYVAGHRRTPLEILISLAQHQNAQIRHAVFMNQHIPSTVLALGLGDPDFLCRACIAGHRNLTEELATRLLDDESLQVLHGVARNLHLSQETQILAERKVEATIEHRKKHNPTRVRKRARSIVEDEITWDYFQRCVDDRVAGVRIAVKLGAFDQGLIDLNRCVAALRLEKMPSLVFEYTDLISPLKALAVMHSLEYQGPLKGHLKDDWSEDREVVVAALETKRAYMAWDVVQSVELDAELLELLAHCERMSLTFNVARQKGFVKWPESIVRGGICDTFVPQIIVALHSSTTSETMNVLRKSRSAPVRAAMVAKMEPSELVQAAQSAMPLVRTAVALHPETTDATYTSLAMDPDEGVRAAVLSSHRATDEIRALAKLSTLSQ